MVDWKESERGTAETAPAPDHIPAAKDSEDMATSKFTKAPAFQFYPKDFLSSSKVDRMSMTERGIYITLLSFCWLDGSLPTDVGQLARLVRIREPQFNRIWNGALSECFTEKDGRLINPRLERERRAQADYRRRQKDNAVKGWQGRRNATALPRSDPSHQSGNALQSASASASAVPTPNGVGRPAPLVQRRRKDAAFEYGRLYVPQRAHDDLMMLGNHEGGEAGLWAFYEQVCEEYTSGARQHERIRADLIEFWKERYQERWPPPASAKTATKALPAWAKR